MHNFVYLAQRRSQEFSPHSRFREWGGACRPPPWLPHCASAREAAGRTGCRRHVGDLGNVQPDADGDVSETRQDRLISLFGQNNIVGRVADVRAYTYLLTYLLAHSISLSAVTRVSAPGGKSNEKSAPLPNFVKRGAGDLMRPGARK